MHGFSNPKWTCWEITHAGEGGRGRRVVVNPCYAVETAEEAATIAAKELDNLEQFAQRMADGDFDDTERVIEVETEAGPRRFRVYCHVVRNYKAQEVPNPC